LEDGEIVEEVLNR